MPERLGLRFLLLFMLFSILLALYGLGSWAYDAIRNYQGYCTALGEKHNTNLTTDQRLRIAVSEYLRSQASTDFHEIAYVENSKGKMMGHESLRENFSLLTYSSESEFFKFNPDCCDRIGSLVEGDQFGFWERAGGSGDGMFNFTHKVRYSARNGVSKEFSSTRTFVTVSNCGNATIKSYH